MIRSFLASVALIVALLAPRGVAAAGKPTVAILGLEVIDDGSGVDAKGTQFAKELTDELRKRPKAGTGPYALAPGSDKDLLELKLLSGCESEDKACMAGIGSDLAADRLLYGKVELRTDGYQVSLKLLDVAAKSFERSISDIVPFAEATGANLASWGKKLYAKLTGATAQGTLVIEANVDRGTVYLDGQVKGTLSAGKARIAGLSEGSYKLKIESEGHFAYEATVEISGGVDTTHKAELEGNGVKGGGDHGTGDKVVGGDGGNHEIVTGTVSSAERPGGGYRALFWTSLVLTAGSATGVTVFGLKVRGDDANAKDAAISAWQSAALPPDNQLDLDDACGDASTRLAGQNVQERTLLEQVDSACKTGQNHALITNVLIGATAVTAVATVLFYYKGYIASKSSSESATSAMARRGAKRPRGATVTFAPAVSPTQIGAGMRIDF